MRPVAVTLAASLLSAIATPVLAEPVSAKAVEEKDVLSGKVKLDPAQGYILVSGPLRQSGLFLRVPDDAARIDWEADRQKAFVKAQKRYQSALAQWQTDLKVAEHTKAKPPERPVEPTIDSFGFEPLELRDQVSFGPMYVYSKGDPITYLEQVKPGTYIWYGNIFIAPNGTMGGTCLCMGTVRFDVKPGIITDLGNSLNALPHWDDDLDVARLKMRELNSKRAADGKPPVPTLAGGELRYGLPASLRDWPTIQVELHANPKLNNYFGVVVSRMAPIPGILAYHRDTVVDGRTGQELVSPTLISRAKPKL
jgi:hypothetical protein